MAFHEYAMIFISAAVKIGMESLLFYVYFLDPLGGLKVQMNRFIFMKLILPFPILRGSYCIKWNSYELSKQHF